MGPIDTRSANYGEEANAKEAEAQEGSKKATPTPTKAKNQKLVGGRGMRKGDKTRRCASRGGGIK